MLDLFNTILKFNVLSLLKQIVFSMQFQGSSGRFMTVKC